MAMKTKTENQNDAMSSVEKPVRRTLRDDVDIPSYEVAELLKYFEDREEGPQDALPAITPQQKNLVRQLMRNVIVGDVGTDERWFVPAIFSAMLAADEKAVGKRKADAMLRATGLAGRFVTGEVNERYNSVDWAATSICVFSDCGDYDAVLKQAANELLDREGWQDREDGHGRQDEIKALVRAVKTRNSSVEKSKKD